MLISYKNISIETAIKKDNFTNFFSQRYHNGSNLNMQTMYWNQLIAKIKYFVHLFFTEFYEKAYRLQLVRTIEC